MNVSLKRLGVIGGVVNIVIPMIIFAIGVIIDSGGSSFGYIFVGLAMFGCLSFLYFCLILFVCRKALVKSTVMLAFICFFLAVNLFEILLVKDFALWG